MWEKILVVEEYDGEILVYLKSGSEEEKISRGGICGRKF